METASLVILQLHAPQQLLIVLPMVLVEPAQQTTRTLAIKTNLSAQTLAHVYLAACSHTTLAQKPFQLLCALQEEAVLLVINQLTPHALRFLYTISSLAAPLVGVLLATLHILVNLQNPFVI
jgi:hypothetical protein